MTNLRAAAAYKRADLETAPKENILDRLFARFLADAATARAAIQANDIQAKGNAINHGQQIIIELKAALDGAAAPELVANLHQLYDFANARMTRANLKMSVGDIDDAVKVMDTVGTAFREARGLR